MNAPQNIKAKVSSSISIKLLVIFLLILILQIPLTSVKALTQERQNMKYQAQNQIAKRWGGSQRHYCTQ